MRGLRYLLFPFTCIYFPVVWIRNILFDKGITKSSEFDVPVICIGNLSTGGTGKTPHVEYLIRLLKDSYHVATLSRGYGRKTPGYQQATEEVTAKDIGDEPFQLYSKFKGKVNIFVEVKRTLGIINIMSDQPQTDLIILDDAYQHRAVKAGLTVLLTDYNRPYFKDYILPVGNLRESTKGRERADIVIVTKCPKELGNKEKVKIKEKLKLTQNQKAFFTTIKYGDIKSFNPQLPYFQTAWLKEYEILLITGIANPSQFLKKIKESKAKVNHLNFPDHHNFTKKNISNIIDIFGNLKSERKIILTTEKDAVRLKNIKELAALPIYYWEIEIEFLEEKNIFDENIRHYIEEHKRDSQLS